MLSNLGPKTCFNVHSRTRVTVLQGLSQRPVQQSSGRPIISLGVKKYCQIQQNCIVGGPGPRPGPTISKFGLPFIISLQCCRYALTLLFDLTA